MDYVLEKSQQKVLRFAGELQKIAEARNILDVITFNTELDESWPTFVRDYRPLVDAGLFRIQSEGEYSVTVSPVGNDDTDSFTERVKDVLDKQLFRQEVAGLALAVKEAIDMAQGIGQIEIQTTLTTQAACVPYLDELLSNQDYPIRTILHEDDTLGLVIECKDTEDDEATLFVHSPTAKKLVQALEGAGYTLDRALINELITESDHRYGNAYAWISRQLVKEISGYPGDLWSPETAATEIAPTGDAGADLIIDIVNQLSRRAPGSDAYSDIPATMHSVELRDKGCKDVEIYFTQSVDIGTLSQVKIGDKTFWHKTNGGKTYLNLEPITYKGIALPPGFVFKQSEIDGSYALLRATAFAFDEARGDQLFGMPYSKFFEDTRFLRQRTKTFAAFAYDSQNV